MAAESEFALVRQHLEAALQQTVEWVTDLDLHIALVDTAARQRDLDGLRHYLPLAERSLAEYDHPLYQPILIRARGVAHWLAGELAEAEVQLVLALELFKPLDTHWQIGRTLRELGELVSERGEPTQARARFTEAIAAFEQLRAAPDIERMRGRLEELTR